MSPLLYPPPAPVQRDNPVEKDIKSNEKQPYIQAGKALLAFADSVQRMDRIKLQQFWRQEQIKGIFTDLELHNETAVAQASMSVLLWYFMYIADQQQHAFVQGTFTAPCPPHSGLDKLFQFFSRHTPTYYRLSSHFKHNAISHLHYGLDIPRQAPWALFGDTFSTVVFHQYTDHNKQKRIYFKPESHGCDLYKPLDFVQHGIDFIKTRQSISTIISTLFPHKPVLKKRISQHCKEHFTLEKPFVTVLDALQAEQVIAPHDRQQLLCTARTYGVCYTYLWCEGWLSLLDEKTTPNSCMALQTYKLRLEHTYHTNDIRHRKGNEITLDTPLSLSKHTAPNHTVTTCDLTQSICEIKIHN